MCSLSLNHINNLPYYKGFPKNPNFGSGQKVSAVPEQKSPITAKIATNLQSIQAQYKIKPFNVNKTLTFDESKAYPLPLDCAEIRENLDELVKSGKIKQSDYDRIINGKSEISYLLANNPYCHFSSNFICYLFNLSNRDSPILTDFEGDCFIGHYSFNGNGAINDALRGRDALDDELKTIKKGLVRALDKLPSYTGTVYRRENYFDDAAHLKVGDIYNPKEFLSTTTDLSQSEYFGSKYKFVIKSKNGKSIDKIAYDPGEKEVLFKCDSKFKILAIEDKNGVKTYHMEEINTPESGKSDLLNSIQNKASEIVPIEVKFNDKSMKLEKFIDTQSGSNTGNYYKNLETNEFFYIKFPGEARAREEVLATKLYELAGIKVPEVNLIQENNNTGVASKIIENLGDCKNIPNFNAHEGFGVDAWLANWDVVGLEYDNLKSIGNKAVRLDTGGALRYRAQGALKGTKWNENVDELVSLTNGFNRQSQAIFGHMTRKQVIDSLSSVSKIKDEDIISLVNKYVTDEKKAELAKTLIKRKHRISQISELMKKTEKPESISISEYISDILENTKVSKIQI